MTDAKNNLLLLFERPQEPVFMVKGDKKAVFNVPPRLLADRFKDSQPELSNRFGQEAEEVIQVQDISIPDLGEALELGRHENFSLFIPKHRRIAGNLISIFLGVRSVEDLQSIAVYARDRINPYLFNYALSVALLHRPDTKDLDLPSLAQNFPDKYIDGAAFGKAREEANLIPDGSRTPIEIPVDYTASNLETEHRLAYWREDVGINLHHWHWHQVYPFEGPRVIVDKDRRGELWYYAHQQIIARYNFERFCNDLPRVKRYKDFSEPIEEAYFSKLDSLVASRGWPARVSGMRPQDLRRPFDDASVTLQDMKRWRDRILAAINSGMVQDSQGNSIPLTEETGIDMLGNMLESNILSINQRFYGNYHGNGHLIIGFIHDPDNRNLEPVAVMGDLATTMRDPLFYRWHSHIDDIFHEYKATLPRYNTNRLDYPGITVRSIEITSGNKKNEFNTFWQQSDIDLSQGMDFQPRGNVFARLTHLNHQPFSYKITVNNESNGSRRGTCRIFLAPKFDERGNPWTYNEQRIMFIEMDRFIVNLKQGQNTITRHSTESEVTVPFERTFRNLNLKPTEIIARDQFNYCICGWPQHVLVPKGSSEGFACQLFVMISNYNDDRVDQDIQGECNDATSYCGLRDKKYPDRRSMGYPFDRPARDGVSTLNEFLTPNMRVQDVSIKFSNRTFRPKQTQ